MRELMGAKIAGAEAAGCMLWDLSVQEEHAVYLVRPSGKSRLP